MTIAMMILVNQHDSRAYLCSPVAHTN